MAHPRSHINYCSTCGTKVEHSTPKGDSRERAVCPSCDTVHYQNPLIVVGCLPERDGKVLLCKRAIEPRYGFWTVPAGFMELDESIAEGAARETMEEACAEVEIGHLIAAVDIPEAGQLHLFFTAKLVSDHTAGDETLETGMFGPDEIPWDEIAFLSGSYALKKWIQDAGSDNGCHVKVFRRPKRD